MTGPPGSLSLCGYKAYNCWAAEVKAVAAAIPAAQDRKEAMLLRLVLQGSPQPARSTSLSTIFLSKDSEKLQLQPRPAGRGFYFCLISASTSSRLTGLR